MSGLRIECRDLGERTPALVLARGEKLLKVLEALPQGLESDELEAVAESRGVVWSKKLRIPITSRRLIQA